jgi:hypothetical protein
MVEVEMTEPKLTKAERKRLAEHTVLGKSVPANLAGKALAEIERLEQDAIEMRRQVWLSHGCGTAALYGDDGEMQCGKCLIDFKRDEWPQIRDRLDSIALQRAQREALKESR